MGIWCDANAQLGYNGKRGATGEGSSGTQLVFLGSGAACGVPTYYCDCPACREAKRDPRARRTCSSIALLRDETTLIDASPEIHQQLEREGISDVSRVLFTHEHFDHCGGVPQLEYYVRLRRHSNLPFYCNDQTAAHLESHFDFMADTFDLHRIGVGSVLEFDGIRYEAIAASHCPGALGYLIEVPTSGAGGPSVAGGAGNGNGAGSSDDAGITAKIAYIPDTSFPVADTVRAIKGIDVLIIDATFNGGNWMPTQHLSIDDACQLAADLGVGHAYLTHLSMQFDEPITLEQLDSKLEGTNVTASYDGLMLSF